MISTWIKEAKEREGRMRHDVIVENASYKWNVSEDHRKALAALESAVRYIEWTDGAMPSAAKEIKSEIKSILKGDSSG